MAKLEILTWPNPILKKKGVPVPAVTSELAKLAHKMLETMYSSNGIGLAAPQIGQSIRLVVIDTQPRDEDNKVILEEMTELERKIRQPLILFNPDVVKKADKTISEEGCLSVPGFLEDVERSKIIQVTYLDEKGEKKKLETDGLLAICIQHEIDHLDGKLFIDRLSTIKSDLIKTKIRKHGYPKRANSSHNL